MNISAIILAAGGSTRMIGKNKLLLPYDNTSIINHVCRIVLNTSLHPVIVVTGFENIQVEKALPNEITRIVYNEDWEQGMATSVNRGISSLPEDTKGSMIVLGDMPLVNSVTLEVLISAFNHYNGNNIIYPLYEKQQGNPVIFPRQYFSEILMQNGDRGCKKVLHKYPKNTIEVPILSNEVVLDCDTQDDYLLIKSKKSLNV